MKTANTWKFRPIVGKIMMGLVLAVMTASSSYVVPALGEDDHKDMGRRDNGRYEQKQGREHDRDRHVQRRRDNRPYYGDRERGYVPPRVIYAPPPPSGISIFFPPIVIRP